MFYVVSSLAVITTVTGEVFFLGPILFVCFKKETVTNMSPRLNLTKPSTSVLRGEKTGL